ncbi:hypothetical protein [Acidithiobacillus ferridurans]|jgi:hypothetical protein|uniref:hypothetical protein n=1 Tax=Acidithiobacillus ferridurans TaxID=1232575 RepID=UPI001C075D86|nr:hypothetical protein [Acidithiobacillus ferridurans]MBU2732696.1 hypothetical protein [Acidithiobacillus ferridurans]
MRIEKAFCVELGRSLDIEQAREAYFAQKDRHRFTFLCSDERCRASDPENGIRVSGVNYDKLPNVDTIFKTAHFRRQDPHISSCYWMEIKEAEDLERASKSGNDLISALTAKGMTVITRFSVPKTIATDTAHNEEQDEIDQIRMMPSRDERIPAYRKLFSGGGSSTKSLENLVSCYEELKREEALDIKIHVDKHGDYSFRDLFCHVANIKKDNRFHVYYGGAKLYKRYRPGFSIYFFDNVDVGNGQQRLSLYVDKQKTVGANHLTETVDTAESNPQSYLTVYWIGGVREGERGLAVDINSLRHLALRFKIPQPRD